MLSINEIQNFYPKNLKGYKNFILREYLQYKILEIIFESKYADKLCFLGGTCLRIVFNNTRFSEDLDFDNFNLSETDFNNISKIIETQLLRQGYDVEINNVFAGAFHCCVRFPKLLFNEGISGHKEEKILIQLDTEPQHFEYKAEKVILNKFDVFTSINTTPQDILLAQKFYALINRKLKKGRDFFDIIFLLKTTQPNFEYLQQKLKVNNKISLQQKVFDELDKVNLKEICKEVQPFLFDQSDVKHILLFKDYISQIF